MSERAWIAACSLGSLALFLGAVYARLHLEYGPFDASLSPADWMALWDLYRPGRIVGEGAAAGILTAALPWLLYAVRRA